MKVKNNVLFYPIIVNNDESWEIIGLKDDDGNDIGFDTADDAWVAGVDYIDNEFDDNKFKHDVMLDRLGILMQSNSFVVPTNEGRLPFPLPVPACACSSNMK